MGANALVGLSYTKGTGSAGNYRFTIHNVFGRPAVIMEPQMTSDLAAVVESERKCEAMASTLEQGYEAYIAHLAEMRRLAEMQRRKIIRNWLIGLTVVGGIVALLLSRSV
jgi:hypothetical protein